MTASPRPVNERLMSAARVRNMMVSGVLIGFCGTHLMPERKSSVIGPTAGHLSDVLLFWRAESRYFIRDIGAISFKRPRIGGRAVGRVHTGNTARYSGPAGAEIQRLADIAKGAAT
jgi:hypothetical protein